LNWLACLDPAAFLANNASSGFSLGRGAGASPIDVDDFAAMLVDRPQGLRRNPPR
jgi:hypothetical protein